MGAAGAQRRLRGTGESYPTITFCRHPRRPELAREPGGTPPNHLPRHDATTLLPEARLAARVCVSIGELAEGAPAKKRWLSPSPTLLATACSATYFMPGWAPQSGGGALADRLLGCLRTHSSDITLPTSVLEPMTSPRRDELKRVPGAVIARKAPLAVASSTNARTTTPPSPPKGTGRADDHRKQPTTLLLREETAEGGAASVASSVSVILCRRRHCRIRRRSIQRCPTCLYRIHRHPIHRRPTRRHRTHR